MEGGGLVWIFLSDLSIRGCAHTLPCLVPWSRLLCAHGLPPHLPSCADRANHLEDKPLWTVPRGTLPFSCSDHSCFLQALPTKPESQWVFHVSACCLSSREACVLKGLHVHVPFRPRTLARTTSSCFTCREFEVRLE